MKKLIIGLALAMSAVGCTSYSAIATAPNNKVFITKTTTYLIWTSNKMEICDYANGAAQNCNEVTEN